MKTLLIMRHGEAEGTGLLASSTSDFNRSLTDKGMQDVRFIASSIAKLPELPELILASSAVRTQMTATIVAETIDYPLDALQLTDRLYNASLEEFLKLIQGLPDAHARVLCVGHNPTVSALVNHLSQHELSAMSPGSLHVLDSDASTWAALPEIKARCRLFLEP